MENLWPKFAKKEEETPKSILQAQVSFFNELELGLNAYLTTTQASPEDIFDLGEPSHLLHTLIVRATSLDGFTFTLLRAVHKTVSIYPVEIYSNIENKKYSASKPDELKEALANIFKAKETTDAIQNLISQIE